MLLLSDVGSKTRGHLRGLAIGGGHRFFLGRECRLDKNFPDVGEPDDLPFRYFDFVRPRQVDDAAQSHPQSLWQSPPLTTVF
jgi:hypothetical protein